LAQFHHPGRAKQALAMTKSSGSSRSSSRRRFRPLQGEAIPERAGRRRQRSTNKGLEQAVLSALQYDSSSDDNERGSVKKSLLAELTAARESTSNVAGDGSEGQANQRGRKKEKVRRRRGTGEKDSSKQADFQQEGGSGSMGHKKKRNRQETKDLNDSHEHQGDDGQKPGRGGRYVRKGRGMKSKVVQDQDHMAGKQPGRDAGVSSGSEDGRRVRIKGNGLIGNKAGAQKDKEVSESEFEPTTDEIEDWRGSLNKHMDKSSDDLRTAFSIKECDTAVIRRLGPESFLGGRKLEEGGLLLYDDEGKANLHFILGSYRWIRRIQSKRAQGDETFPAVPHAERGLVRWLLLQARQLQLISESELKRYKVETRRVEAMKKSRQYSLALKANWAAASGYEQQDTPEKKAAHEVDNFDAHFPQRRAERQEGSNTVLQERLRSQAVSRQSGITVQSSCTVDMQRVKDALLAPKMSFDWEDKTGDDDDDETGAWGGLEVEIPEEHAVSSSRDIFKDQMRRSVSFHQAKSLRMNDLHLGQRRTKSASDLNTSVSDSVDVAGGDAHQDSISLPPAAVDVADTSVSVLQETAHNNETTSPFESAVNTADEHDSMKVASGPASAGITDCDSAQPETLVQQTVAVAPSAELSDVVTVPAKVDLCTSGAGLASETTGQQTTLATLPGIGPSSSPGATNQQATNQQATKIQSTDNAGKQPSDDQQTSNQPAGSQPPGNQPKGNQPTESETTTAASKSSLLAPEVPVIQSKSVMIGRRGVQAAAPGAKVSTVTPCEAPNDGATDGEAPVLSDNARSGQASVPQLTENVLLAAAQAKVATNSQDWISPTAMWGASPWTPCNSPHPAAGTNTPRAGPGERMPGESFEISPTVPFVPTEEAKEISPTVPFVPTEEAKGEISQAGTNGVMKQHQGHAESANGESFEISPTVPFVAIEEPRVAGASEGLSASSDHVTVEHDSRDLKPHDSRLGSPAPETTRPRLESTVSDSSVALNGDQNDEPVEADQMAEPEEASSQRDEKRRRMEHEWLMHKRQSLLQQEELTRRRKVRRSLEGATDRLRVATMNKEDQGRYDSVVAESNDKNARTALLKLGMPAPVSSEVDDDTSLLGGFANSGHRRPRILLAR